MEELWTGESFRAKLYRGLLAPISWAYALGWQSYLALYRLGIKRPREPHVPVLCVGNLMVGGTGKTPTTIYLARVLQELGFQPVVSCSGYGSSAAEAAALAPPGPLNAGDWGDEAALLRQEMPLVPLIVGRRRVLAAEICHREFPSAVLVLDDGYQHLPLKKHLALILDPPQKNRLCLPAGPYREPWPNRRRADLVVDGGRFRVQRGEFRLHGPDGLAKRVTGHVAVLCALGRPAGFLKSLEATGLALERTVLRPDHDPLTDGNLLDSLPPGIPIIVTGKDWVKLRERADVQDYDFAIASHTVSVEPAEEFREWLQKNLNGILSKAG